jgi:hypothetical protein
VRLGRLGGVLAALALIVLPAGPAGAATPYPPGIDADTILLATPGPGTVAAGGAHSCARTSVGDLYCWGDDSAGQLGDGPAAHGTGRPVLALRDVIRVDAGRAHTCAIDVRGLASCWGDGSAGQLGDGGRSARDAAVAVTTLAGRNLVGITTGARHSCAVDDEGGAWCWGDGSRGQLGRPGLRSSPVPVRVGRLGGPVVEIAAGRDATCAVTAAGAAHCWGSGRDEPVAVAVGPVREITVHGTEACALDAEQQAACWDTRKLVVTSQAAPKHTYRDLDAGENHTCAVDHRGEVSCWSSGAVGVPVEGLPRPPGTVTGLRARALDGGLRVDWRPPAELGSGEFGYFWVTTADYAAGCTLTVATADGCELTGLRNDREYDVAVVVRTADGITVSDFVTATPAAVAPRPSGSPEPRRMSVSVLPGAGGGLPVTGLSPLALVALGTLLLGGGLAALLVRRS